MKRLDDSDAYPFAYIVDDLNQQFEWIDRMSTMMIVLAVVGLVLLGVCQ